MEFDENSVGLLLHEVKKKIVKVGPTVILSMALTNRAIAVTDKRQ